MTKDIRFELLNLAGSVAVIACLPLLSIGATTTIGFFSKIHLSFFAYFSYQLKATPFITKDWTIPRSKTEKIDGVSLFTRLVELELRLLTSSIA